MSSPSGFSPTSGSTPGHWGKTPAAWSMRSSYQAYRSPFGPKYTTAPNFHGITARTAMKYGALLGGFGGVAGIFALFFFAEVPRVRDDIMLKIPVLGDYFVKEVAPEDNPF